ncbi:MAG: hypothetical protein HY548_00775 [Elusimicrobia bacterium]|nr:hypothetical protein [Elusimicrobiota bacterium]
MDDRMGQKDRGEDGVSIFEVLRQGLQRKALKHVPARQADDLAGRVVRVVRRFYGLGGAGQ